MSDSSSVTSLSGFVNVGKLESVLQTLQHRLDSQQSRIDVLERQLAASVPLETYHQLAHRVDATIQHINASFGRVDVRLQEMTSEMSEIQGIVDTLPSLRAIVDAKIDSEQHHKHSTEQHSKLAEQIHALKNDKASKSIVSSLETSQHRLVEEILALQKLISCKIDRVEVPLLDVASEKLQFLLDFQATADMRLDKSENDLVALSKLCGTKEGRDSAAHNLALIRQELHKKVDASFIRDEVISVVNRMEADIVALRATEETVEKLIEDYHTHVEKYTRTEKSLHDLRTDATRLTSDYTTIKEDLQSKVDFKSIDSIVFENSSEIETIVRNYETKIQHESKVQSAYLADVRTQLEDIQTYQNTVDAKLQTALRFIDWFMDVKGKPQ